MQKKLIITAGIALLACTSAHAIDEQYRQQLERSGCTQVSELQGCDIHKSRAENAQAGFASQAPAETTSASSQTPYAGQWVARSSSGRTVATIRIDDSERVWLNGKSVPAKRSDGALVFRDGNILYTIQGDRRLQNEDYWTDFDAGTKGPITAE